jgi:hypothetical protein
MYRHGWKTIVAGTFAMLCLVGCGRKDGAPPPGAPETVTELNVTLDAPKEKDPTGAKTESAPGDGKPAAGTGEK